jgi:predicted ATP-grasp superfamily ATP-dependent carboligase
VERDPLYELLTRPHLEDPVLVVSLDGWIDAGFAAATAAAHLVSQLDPTVVARFDVDVLVDHRSRRPITHLVEGVNTGLTWPRLELRHGKDADGRDVLLLIGSEPDVRWRAFCEQVVALVADLGVHLVVGLGAFPAPVPHTRTLRLASTATTPELAARLPVRATLDVPAGVQAAIERACADANLPAIGIWAQVPHYLVNMTYPAASAALVDGLADLAGLRLDSTPLHEAAGALRTRVDELVAANSEHVEMVRALEANHDRELGEDGMPTGPLPSGDELAAEIERFLREQGRG